MFFDFGTIINLILAIYIVTGILALILVPLCIYFLTKGLQRLRRKFKQRALKGRPILTRQIAHRSRAY